MGNARNIAFWVVLLLLVMVLFNVFNGGTSTQSSRNVAYSEFVSRVDDGNVASVTLDGERVNVRGKDGSLYSTIAPRDDGLTERLLAKGVEVRAESQREKRPVHIVYRAVDKI